MTTDNLEVGPNAARMPLQRQSTFGLYELAEDASDLDYESMPGSICTTPRTGSGDSAKSWTRRQEMQGRASPQSGTTGKKKLMRTDSAVVIVHNNANDDEDVVVKYKPPPSPPILVHDVYVDRRTQRQHTVSGSNAAEVTYHQAIKATSHTGSVALTNCTSCPNLIEDDSVLEKATIRPCKSSEGRLCKTAPPTSPRTSPSLLTVPDVFTTSYTHSKPVHRSLEKVRSGRSTGPQQSQLERHGSVDSSGSEGSGTVSSSEEQTFIPKTTIPDRRQYRYSAPELVRGPEELSELKQIGRKHPLTKSLSDTPPIRATIADEDCGNPSLTDKTEPRISQITNYLCIGNLEAAYNERLLCKNKVTSVLDLSNIQAEDVPSTRKNIAPCTCGSAKHHMRAVLRLTMTESDLVEIKSHFAKINKFIEGARIGQKRVLVYCDSANNNLSILVTAQFLMQNCSMDFRQAYSQIMKSRSDIELNPAYSALLQSLEDQLFYLRDLPEQLVSAKDKSLQMRRRSSGFLPKEAWTDDN